MYDINRAAVIGAGTMGGGITMNFLNAGMPVTLVEQSQEALDRGVSVIRRNYENTAKKGRITQDQVEQAMALIDPTTEIESLSAVDLVIEAVQAGNSGAARGRSRRSAGDADSGRGRGIRRTRLRH